MKSISRKSFLKTSGIALGTLPFALSDFAAYSNETPGTTTGLKNTSLGSVAEKASISIFSKNLHWADVKKMASLVAGMGFDGIDLTVRAGGHVTPENVTRDLPIAVKNIREAGLEVYTITTDIKAADEKHTRQVLKAAANLGIYNYRMGWYDYDAKLSIPIGLEQLKKNLGGLAKLNEEYGIHGDYQNHHGRFGAAIWDLWLALKDLNPKWIGSQFDIRHATLDGAESWPVSIELIKDYIGSICIKDFYWKNSGTKWEPVNVPLGEGMVNFSAYLKLLKKLGINKPISLHYEYALGGAESGNKSITMPENVVISKMKKDLAKLKSWLVV
ncbi:MAG: sugar phosphate isomerase/epimerase family protein [Bacteroidota bacterium]